MKGSFGKMFGVGRKYGGCGFRLRGKGGDLSVGEQKGEAWQVVMGRARTVQRQECWNKSVFFRAACYVDSSAEAEDGGEEFENKNDDEATDGKTNGILSGPFAELPI